MATVVRRMESTTARSPCVPIVQVTLRWCMRRSGSRSPPSRSGRRGALSITRCPTASFGSGLARWPGPWVTNLTSLFWTRATARRSVAEIAGDANDAVHRVASGESDFAPERHLARPEAVPKRLIDHHHPRRLGVVGRGKIAAAERVEISVSRRCHARSGHPPGSPHRAPTETPT